MDTNIDKLQIVIEAEAEKAESSLDRFIASLEKIKGLSSADFGSLGEIQQKFKDLSSSVGGASRSFNNFSKKITNMKAAIEELKGLDLSGATSFAESFKSMEGLQDMSVFGKGINDLSNGLTKLGKLDITTISKKLRDLVDAIRPLTDEMIRGGSQVGTYGEQMRAFVSAAKSATSAQVQMAKAEKMSKTGTGGALGGLMGALKGIKSSAVFAFIVKGVKSISNVLANATKSTIDYIETMDLFNVSLKGFAGKASDFVGDMEAKLGVNATEASKVIGTFMSLANSFGIAGEQAYLMSKNLTQLAYDYSSAYNISVESAFEKLRSGFVGEIEPMRAIGKDLSVARLQQELYNMGINAQVENLTQADKATLRYIVAMKQSGDQMNNLARTIESPANMLRILKAQFESLSRTIGSLFIPVLSAILPYAIAVVKVLNQVAQAIAKFFGVTIPEFGNSNKNFEDTENGLNGIGDAAQQANKDVLTLIGGFDELNKIQVPQADAGGIGTGSVLGDITLPEYDIFAGLVDSKVDAIVAKINNAFKELAQTLKDMGIDEVIEDFKWFGKELYNQIKSYDFGTALKENLLAAVDLAISAVNLSNKMVLPLVIALDIPGIVYETINTFTSFLTALDDVIESITPGMERFVELGLVPIAKWLGERIRDALSFASEKLSELGQWFKDNETRFTDFGEDLGVITDWIWGFIEPLNDVAWESFKKKVEKIVEQFEFWITAITDTVAFIADLIEKAKELDKKMQESEAYIKKFADDFYGLYEVAKGVGDMISGVFKTLIGAAYGDWDVMWEGMNQIAIGGGESLTGVIRGVFGDKAAKPIEDWYLKAKERFDKTEWETNGKNVAAGFSTGVSGVSIAANFFKTFIELAKNILGIHSPSTVFEEIGTQVVAGLEKGVSQWGSVVKVFEAGLEKLKATFSASWTQINTKTVAFFTQFVSTVQSSMDNVHQTIALRTQEIYTFWQESWENLKNLTVDLLGKIKQVSSDAFRDLKSNASTFISGFKSEWTNGWNNIKNSTSSVFSSIKSYASSAFSSITSAVSSMISKIKNAISSLKDLFSWKDKTDDLDFGGESSGGLTGIAGLRARGTGVTTFATGGVVSEPTYALVGEYTSAKNNPEVIAPQSVIEQSVVNANGDMVSALYDMATMVVAAIENNSVTVEADSDAMFKVVRKKGVDYQRNTGKPVFAP